LFFIFSLFFLYVGYAQTAGRGESLLVINKPAAVGGQLSSSAQVVDIYVDGNKKLSASLSNQEYRIVVPNGSHSIQLRRGILKSNILTFAADSNRLEFLIQSTVASIKINKTGEKALGDADVPQFSQSVGQVRNQNTFAGYGDIENALNKAADDLIDAIDAGATVAVLSVSAEDKDMGVFVLEELAY
jgi:hypothetical protein